MKRLSLCGIVLVCMCLTSARAQDEEEYPDAAFFVGTYTLIGKVLEANDTFMGLLVLSIDEKGSGSFERIIGEKVTRGTWGMEYAIGNEVRVVRIRWESLGRHYECTYQWCMDFDTYPRLSGHCYESKTATDSPGMEVGFIKHEEE